MPRKVKGYARVDSEDRNVHGWLVRIRRGEVRRSKMMLDSVYGGKRKSKAAAEALYQEWADELPDVNSLERKMNSRNTTGVVGVHYTCDEDSRFPGCEYESYVASWVNAGKREKIGFSCNKYGNDAFELACIAREKRLTDREEVLQVFADNKPKKKSKKTTKKKVAKAVKKTVKKATKKKVSKKKTAKKKVSTRKKARTRKK